jgi:hypothetical protein
VRGTDLQHLIQVITFVLFLLQNVSFSDLVDAIASQSERIDNFVSYVRRTICSASVPARGAGLTDPAIVELRERLKVSHKQLAEAWVQPTLKAFVYEIIDSKYRDKLGRFHLLMPSAASVLVDSVNLNSTTEDDEVDETNKAIRISKSTVRTLLELAKARVNDAPMPDTVGYAIRAILACCTEKWRSNKKSKRERKSS